MKMFKQYSNGAVASCVVNNPKWVLELLALGWQVQLQAGAKTVA